MTLPNFMIIGAARAGTTSLFKYLKVHPEIFMPEIKQIKFFSLENKERSIFKGPTIELNPYARSLEEYEIFFEEVSGEKMIGEASPIYLYSKIAPVKIKETIPEIKLIVILRDPIERAYSQYNFLRKENFEHIDTFEEAIEIEKKRIENDWDPVFHYKNKGFYYTQLKRYLDVFDTANIKICIFEDLENSPLQLIKGLFRFLDVDESFAPDISHRYNMSTKNKDPAKQCIIAGKSDTMVSEPMAMETREGLRQLFKADIERLEGLIKKDLSKWTK